ncbi:coiled-coil domain-containing protein 42 like-2-like [Tachysurus fulvidraco]|uniref:coiled-coil domain-containing protein 42 like-2-like n=1 Tax=Tachysurus fulvidraco TaxID=1234273 RepID=UPI001FEFED6E|nr:coiled-coil domain-containing protein 42 like-2-like [Tachysurus fulvidraco]
MADFQTSDFRGFQMNGRQQGRQALTLSPPQDETLTHTCQLLRTKIEVIRQQEKVNLQKKEFETFQHAMLERKEKLKENQQKMQDHIKSFRQIKNTKKQQIKAEMQARDIIKMIKENQEILQKLNKKLCALSFEQQR